MRDTYMLKVVVLHCDIEDVSKNQQVATEKNFSRKQNNVGLLLLILSMIVVTLFKRMDD